MKLRVLGCSGGIGGPQLKTTSLLIDQDILIDAGTGVLDLPLDQLAAIDYVFLTHSHLDHIAALPLMIDAVVEHRTKPLVIYSTALVIDILRQHVFNWSIWPDFSLLPSAEEPAIEFRAISIDQAVVLKGRKLVALPANHTVPAVGYWVDSGFGSLVFSGDTGPCEAFWLALEHIYNLKYLLIECAFSNNDQALAQVSKHLTPVVLARELKRVPPPCEIFVTHLKPGRDDLTMQELGQALPGVVLARLLNNQIFEI